MNLTLNTLSNETLNTLLSDLRGREKSLADKLVSVTAELNAVQGDIKAIEAAIKPALLSIKTISIRSDSDYAKWYTVSRGFTTQGALSYTCTCPSFKFSSGTDSYGRCKHILRAINQGGWR